MRFPVLSQPPSQTTDDETPPETPPLIATTEENHRIQSGEPVRQNKNDESRLESSDEHAIPGAPDPLNEVPHEEWPDEEDLLKRILRSLDDDESQQNEFDYIAGCQNAKSEGSPPSTAHVLTLQAYGRVEVEKQRTQDKEFEYLNFEGGQVKRLSVNSDSLRNVLREIVDFYP